MKRDGLGGLLIVAIIAMLLAGCGLTLAFGLTTISKILFLTTVVALVMIRWAAK